DDLKASNSSLVFDSATPPTDALTDIFQVDGNGNLVISADDPYNHLPLLFLICPQDLFIRIGTSSNTCSMVKIGETYSPVSSTPASMPGSTYPSSAPSGSINPASNTPASSGAPAISTPASSNIP